MEQEELERKQSAKKENQPERIRETETQLESQEEIQPKTQSRKIEMCTFLKKPIAGSLHRIV